MTSRALHLIIACLALGCIIGCIAGCAGEHRDARDKYNEGVAALAKGDHEAAEKALLEARSQAGVDPELLFRAAYDLGVAYGAHAEKVRAGKDADLARAHELANQAVSWFHDASRARPGHADTIANLAIMRARAKQIRDELLRGDGKLEARLDRLIGEQRGVLEGARGAWLAIREAGGGDPLDQRDTLIHLADTERGIGAEAGVVGDLAADEIDAIGKKAEDKRSDEEKVRVVQLKNLDLYLMEGRTRITEARRKLQELAAEDGVARAEAALVALKRAREQLLDPITVMRQIAQDELAILQDTARSDTRALALGGAPGQKPDTPEVLPSWLEPGVIGERQGTIRDRLEEVRARLAAAAEAPAPTSGAAAPPSPGSLTPPASGPPASGPPASGPPASGPPASGATGAAGLSPPAAPAAPASPEAPASEDPQRAKLVERVKAALPSVAEASAAMDRARQALGQKRIKQALADEQAALEALAHAIEQFSDLKQLVELAYGEHQVLLQLLSPEAAKQLDAATRAKQTRDALSHNLGRMPRIRELIANEIAQLDQQVSQLAAKAGEPPKDPKEAENAKQQLDQARQQLDQARQQMTHAEELRGQAQAPLAALDKALSGRGDPMPPARDADAKLTELRKLFFSVIEHLQDLIREQGETRDQTSATNGEDDIMRAPKLPGLITRQEGHAQMAKSITDALSQQADAAAKQPPQPGQPPQGPDAKALAGAADEVRQSQGDMADARGTLIKARDATNATESLTPGVKSQAKAIEHLENALKLLQPPPDKNDKSDKDQQQQQQQQQQKQEQPQDPQQQQGGAGQRARDEDARRQRDRQRDTQSDPVEKDW
jgi:hypothetical protein